LVPHDEVLLVAVLADALALEVVAAELLEAAVVGVELELLLLLLLHPAMTPPIAMTATAAPATRLRPGRISDRRPEYLFMSSAFSWLTAKFILNGSGALPSGIGALSRRPDEEHFVHK
jgi:hypothetical protein